jgi:hypothetical protein
MQRPQKITFGEMRESGVFGVVVFCGDYRCSHSTTLPADRWPDQRPTIGYRAAVRLQSVRA